MGEVMSATRLIGLTILLLLALPAGATQCETFTNHSGFVPDGWTATFTENDIEYGPFVGPTFVDPETAYEGNRSWDTAVKCRTETTTTTENTTTTTQPTVPSSTTSIPATTTTAERLTSTSTTTLPPPTSSSTSNPPAPSSTVSTPSTTGPSNPEQVVLDTLPYTGIGDVWPLAGLLLLVAGVGVLTVARREDG